MEAWWLTINNVNGKPTTISLDVLLGESQLILGLDVEGVVQIKAPN